MSVTIVVGGQYGSEGKGKVVQHVLQNAERMMMSIRCGGPNSGHTVEVGTLDKLNPEMKGVKLEGADNQPVFVILKQLPAGSAVPGTLCVIPPGAVVDVALLKSEIKTMMPFGLTPDRVFVDNRAVILMDSDKEAEISIVDGISSTGSGNGRALIRRMARRQGIALARDAKTDNLFIKTDTVSMVNSWIDSGGDVVVEGNQGFGLSLLHGDYPYCTSRDVTAAGFCSECGIAPRDVNRVICVIRTYPIRVGSVEGGTSGPMPGGEISWEEIGRRGGVANQEFTSVTKRLRRVSEFDWDLVRRAIRVNGATELAVMGLDRLNAADANVKVSDLSDVSRSFFDSLEEVYRIPVTYIGTGPAVCERVR